MNPVLKERIKQMDEVVKKLRYMLKLQNAWKDLKAELEKMGKTEPKG